MLNLAVKNPLALHQMPLRELPEIPDFEDILALYAEKRVERLMPRWKDFSFSEFAGWHPRIALSKREDADFRFRIFGTSFVELFDRDLTGELLIASMMSEQALETARHFKRLVDGPMIGFAKGRVPVNNRTFLRFEVVDLPLANANGDVSHFLHVCAPPRFPSSRR